MILVLLDYISISFIRLVSLIAGCVLVFRNSYIKLCSDENVEQMTMEDAKNSLVNEFYKVMFSTMFGKKS